MHGTKLRLALERTERLHQHTIQVVDKSCAVTWLTPSQAIDLIDAFPLGHWAGSGSARNVKSICYQPPKPVERPLFKGDAGFGFLRYPMPMQSSLSVPFPALARMGAGLA